MNAAGTYRYDKRDEPEFNAGHAAYMKDGPQARNPHDPRKLPIRHGAWQCGRDAAHREAFEKRQREFIANHA